ncbi:hypothetical protein VMCG_10726 [Cytospora schulzeri]|uniref:Uncharacterized protein n=1 Tax=Cytospora schulzeri TaxID=448051 RepID=A0A423V8Z1_9PEZI|nr:hypothetical protein VMCG_10726 [Valsa malicola]
MSGRDDNDHGDGPTADPDADGKWKERDGDVSRWSGKSIRINVPSRINNIDTNTVAATDESNGPPAQWARRRRRSEVQKGTSRNNTKGQQRSMNMWARLCDLILWALLLQTLAIIAAVLWQAQPWLCPFPYITSDGLHHGDEGASAVRVTALLPQIDADGMRCRMAALGDQLQGDRFTGSCLPSPEHVRSAVTHLAELHDLEVEASHNVSALRRLWDELEVQRAYARSMAAGVHPLLTFSHPHQHLLGTQVAPWDGNRNKNSNSFVTLLLLLSSPRTWLVTKVRVWAVLHIEPLLRHLRIANCCDAGHQHYEAIKRDTRAASAYASIMRDQLAEVATLLIEALDRDMVQICFLIEVLSGGKASNHYKLLEEWLMEDHDHAKDDSPAYRQQQYHPNVLEGAALGAYNDAVATTRNICAELRTRVLQRCESAYKTSMQLGTQAGLPKLIRKEISHTEVWQWCLQNSEGGLVQVISGLANDLQNAGFAEPA